MAYPRPFTVFPGIVQRSPYFIDLQVRDRPEVNAVRLWGSTNLEDAYGTWAASGLTGTGGTMFAEAARGTSFVSRSCARTQLVEESRRGMMRFYFNPDDFVDPAALSPMPSDDAVLFVRQQESHVSAGGYLAVPGGAPLNAGNPIQGPILVIPPAIFWHDRHPALTLAGTGPAATGCTVGNIPLIDPTLQTPPPLHLVLPRPAKLVTIADMTGGTTLLVSSGLGVPMAELGSVPINFEGGIREIVLANGADFSIFAVFDMEG